MIEWRVDADAISPDSNRESLAWRWLLPRRFVVAKESGDGKEWWCPVITCSLCAVARMFADDRYVIAPGVVVCWWCADAESGND